MAAVPGSSSGNKGSVPFRHGAGSAAPLIPLSSSDVDSHQVSQGTKRKKQHRKSKKGDATDGDRKRPLKRGKKEEARASFNREPLLWKAGSELTGQLKLVEPSVVSFEHGTLPECRWDNTLDFPEVVLKFKLGEDAIAPTSLAAEMVIEDRKGTVQKTHPLEIASDSPGTCTATLKKNRFTNVRGSKPFCVKVRVANRTLVKLGGLDFPGKNSAQEALKDRTQKLEKQLVVMEESTAVLEQLLLLQATVETLKTRVVDLEREVESLKTGDALNLHPKPVDGLPLSSPVKIENQFDHPPHYPDVPGFNC